MTENLNPYFQLFKGEVVAKSKIDEHSPETLAALSALISDGRVVGQYNYETDDIELFMPEYLKGKRLQKISPAPHEREMLQKNRRSERWDFGETETSLDIPPYKNSVEKIMDYFKEKLTGE